MAVCGDLGFVRVEGLGRWAGSFPTLDPSSEPLQSNQQLYLFRRPEPGLQSIASLLQANGDAGFENTYAYINK